MRSRLRRGAMNIAAVAVGAALPAVVIAASANVPGAAASTGALPGSPFAVGQFVVMLVWNSGTAAANLTAPASGTTEVYDSNNGSRAAGIYTIASLASAVETLTYNATRTRTRTVGFENVQTGLVDWSVDYGVTPLQPSALDVTGKPRSVIYAVVGGGTNTYSTPGDLTDDGGANGSNGTRRAYRDTPVGAVSSYQIGAWTSTDNAQQAVAISVAVE